MISNERVLPYVEAAILSHLRHILNDVKLQYVDRARMVHILDEMLPHEDVREFCEMALDNFTKNGVVELISDDLAGDFFSLSQDGIRKVTSVLGEDIHSIYAKTRRIGSGLLAGVLSNIRLSEDEIRPLEIKSASVPASDRVVQLSHNQVDELDQAAEEIIDAVKAQNKIDGPPHLREMILGQLRAGRELIRSGCVRLYVLEVTLIETLRFLVKRYENELIGGLASALIAALVKLLGIEA